MSVDVVEFREEFVAHRARVEAQLEGLGRRVDHVAEAKRRHAEEILGLVGALRAVEHRVEERLGAVEAKLQEMEAASVAQHEAVTAEVAAMGRTVRNWNALLAAIYALLGLAGCAWAAAGG